jgi:thymidylate synthase
MHLTVLARDQKNGTAKGGRCPWYCPVWESVVEKLRSESTIKEWPEPGSTLVLCTVLGSYQCDTVVTDTDLQLESYHMWARRHYPGCIVTVYVRHPESAPPSSLLRSWHTEKAYLDLCRDILDHGENRDDRTGTGTRSVFGRQLVFDLTNGFPLLTTKKTFWKGIRNELLWFLRGQTDASILSRDGVRIWDANTSPDALKKRGLAYKDGDCGPVYGFQWRHWGADYRGCAESYEGQGHDQLRTLVRNLRDNPMSRRHIVSAWNVEDLDRMALPPCHILFQCYVTNRRSLDIQVYQRSVDVGLGLPFNIASYATLNHLLCSLTGYTPGRLIMSLGDCHVYRDHLDQIREQLKGAPHTPPRLLIKNNSYDRLEQFTERDIQIVDYHPSKTIPMRMST